MDEWFGPDEGEYCGECGGYGLMSHSSSCTYFSEGWAEAKARIAAESEQDQSSAASGAV